MNTPGFEDTLARLDWREMGAQLDDEGYALMPSLFSPQEALDLARFATGSGGLHTTRLEDLNLGQGAMHILGDAVPPPLAELRSALYRHLAPIADRWNEMQGMDAHLPRSPVASAVVQPRHRQDPSPSHLTRLRKDDFVALHLCAGSGGESTIPLRLVALLSRPGEDFDGGQLVLTEQRPRMQSRPSVVPLQFGDAAVICAHQRPIRGSSGTYRVTIRNAISRVRRGTRIGLELSFHAYAPPHA